MFRVHYIIARPGRPGALIRVARVSAPRARRRRSIAIGALVSATVAQLAAQSVGGQAPRADLADTVRLTLEEARARAQNANPELLAARLDTSVARGELRQAGVLLQSNPSAELLGARGGNGTEAAISQEIEVFGQRGVRIDASRAGLERAAAAVANATRLTLGDVDRAFYRLVSAARRTALADEVLSLNQRLAEVAKRQLAAGEISRLDYNLAVVEFGRSRSRALASRRERDRTAVELERLVGLPRGTPIEPVLDPTQHTAQYLVGLTDSAGRLDVDRLTRLALERRPDVAERAAAARRSAAQASLARREAFPNIVVRGASEPAVTGSGRALRPGVGVALPVFNLNRGEVSARRATARQDELRRYATSIRVRAEIASAVASYQSAATEVDVLESTVLEPARQNRQLSETAYREGEIGLPVLLLIRNQVIDAELEYWAAWLAERESLAALLEATGQNVAPAAAVAR